MDKGSYKIAVASSDGIVVNNHFGRASKFYIYQASLDGDITFIEQRNVSPVCEMGNHDDGRLNENLDEFTDCEYILVSKIGDGAAFAARQKGIESYEIPGIISESIHKMIQYVKLQKLFE